MSTQFYQIKVYIIKAGFIVFQWFCNLLHGHLTCQHSDHRLLNSDSQIPEISGHKIQTSEIIGHQP